MMKTPSMIQACECTLGPYRGYVGHADYDADARLFHGSVLGTRDVITFQSEDIATLSTAFEESVDDYLDFCRARGESPDKPFSGQFVARIRPETHRAISALAQAKGKSLNQFVRDLLEEVAAGSARSRSAKSGRVPRRKAKPTR